MKKLIPTFVILFFILGFTTSTRAQVKYGVVAYQYFKNDEGKRILKYDVRKFEYNTAAAAKAAVDIWHKSYEKKDSDIVYNVVSLDVAASNAAKTYYQGTFKTRVRNKEGVERTIEDVRYCIFKTELDFMENVIVMLQYNDEIIEPLVFDATACKS